MPDQHGPMRGHAKNKRGCPSGRPGASSAWSGPCVDTRKTNAGVHLDVLALAVPREKIWNMSPDLEAISDTIARIALSVLTANPVCPEPLRKREEAGMDQGQAMSRTNTRVHEEEELMVINIDSSEQSRA